jgi:hypothetical protein
MKAVAETVQLKEREVGGADSEQTLEPAQLRNMERQPRNRAQLALARWRHSCLGSCSAAASAQTTSRRTSQLPKRVTGQIVILQVAIQQARW